MLILHFSIDIYLAGCTFAAKLQLQLLIFSCQVVMRVYIFSPTAGRERGAIWQANNVDRRGGDYEGVEGI